MKIAERKEKEKLIRRNDIINAAEIIFAAKGFEYATMDDIAKEAGFTKKTLYSYFNSKEELYYEIMLRGFKTLNSICDEALFKEFDKSECEKIKTLGRTFIDFSYKYPGYFKAIMDYKNKEQDFKKDSKNTIIEQCYEAGEHSLDILKECIVKGIETGEFSGKNNPVIVCITLWSYILGFVGLVNNKERYINIYCNKNGNEIIEDSFEIILNSIKSGN
jgi:AcrR family transcriptional regulator